MVGVVRPMLLSIVDTNWMEFLSFLGYLQTNLKFKSMAGGNVLLTYSLESFEMFKELNREIQSMITINTLRSELRLQP
ncbi:preprotein translocase subunit SecA [compost metagenome]